MNRIAVTWAARARPLPARAVVAIGGAARALGRRIAALDDDALAALDAVVGAELLLVRGDAERLPWVDGVVYLGRDPDAPDLLVPTALEPSVPAAVLARAVRARIAEAPVAVLASPHLLVPCAGARAIDRGLLAAWLEAA
ncbi:MAG: hypothetical protein K8W52_44770 [Deltaproteobacteria bacterium]|nr:hypothetical protein [Deltaproteobacteria bacterium]